MSPSPPVELMTLSGFSLYLNRTRGGDLRGMGDRSSSREERRRGLPPRTELPPPLMGRVGRPRTTAGELGGTREPPPTRPSSSWWEGREGTTAGSRPGGSPGPDPTENAGEGMTGGSEGEGEPTGRSCPMPGRTPAGRL